MVEQSLEVRRKFATQQGPMHAVFEFLDPKSLFTIQGMNKRQYDSNVPMFKPSWPMSKSDFVLVKGRKKFYLTTWSKGA